MFFMSLVAKEGFVFNHRITKSIVEIKDPTQIEMLKKEKNFRPFTAQEEIHYKEQLKAQVAPAPVAKAPEPVVAPSKPVEKIDEKPVAASTTEPTTPKKKIKKPVS